jgi:protease I
MANELNGIRIAILSTDGFELVELTEPKRALEEAGADVKVLTPTGKKIQGMKHDEKSDFVESDGTIADAKPGEFDAVHLPGGTFNADALRIDQDAQEFARQIDRQGKPLSVICHGPWLLVSAGLVKGRTLTSWPTLQDDIRNAGGTWVDREVVRDKNWVSSRKPDNIPAFNRELISLLQQSGKQKAA